MKLIIILILIVISLGVLAHSYFKKENLSSKVYRIAIDETWYPLNLFNKKEDLLVFSEELIQTIAKKQNFSIQLLQVGSDNLFQGLDEGDYEAVLSSLIVLEKNGANYAFTSSTSIEENSESYIFSKPYYLLGPVIVVSSSSPIKSVKELNGKTIGITKGSIPVSYLINNSSINLIFYDYNDNGKLVDDVINHVIDGMILDTIPAYEYTKSTFFQSQLKIASVPLNREGLRLIAKNNPESEELIFKFNEGLMAIKKNGVYGQLLSKWDLFNPLN